MTARTRGKMYTKCERCTKAHKTQKVRKIRQTRGVQKKSAGAPGSSGERISRTVGKAAESGKYGTVRAHLSRLE